jgi:hypothetical protein
MQTTSSGALTLRLSATAILAHTGGGSRFLTTLACTPGTAWPGHAQAVILRHGRTSPRRKRDEAVPIKEHVELYNAAKHRNGLIGKVPQKILEATLTGTTS